MKHTILGVVAGYVVWTAIWLGGNATLFSAAAEQSAAGEAVTAIGTLAGVLLLSIVCSLVAGMVAGWLGKQNAAQAVLITGVLLVLTGIGVQASVWSLMPVWYHLSFLLLILPVAMLGARLIKGSS
tara:strand:- start:110710 stop:111087 length:378 start_codon:yes stop_codon:yes gene_type:complete